MALGDLVKRLFVRFEVDGAEDAKLQIDDLAARAHDIGDVHIGADFDDKEAKLKMDALKLELRAMEMKGADKQAFQDLADQFKNIGDNADGARLKTAALGLELRAIKDMTKFGEDNNNGGGFFDRALGGVMGGLFGKLAGPGGQGIGSGLPVVGSLAGAIGPLPVLAGVLAIVGSLLNEIAGVVSGFAAAAQGVVAFGILAYPTLDRIFSLIGASKKRLDKLPEGMRKAVEGIQGLEHEWKQLALKERPEVFRMFNEGLKIAGQLLQDLPPFANTAFRAMEPLLNMFNKWLGSKQAQQLQNSFLKIEGPAINSIGQGIGNVLIATAKLLTTLSGKDDAHAINMFFDTIAGLIDGLAKGIKITADVWDYLSKQAVIWWHVTYRAGKAIADFFSGPFTRGFEKIGSGLAATWRQGIQSLNQFQNTVTTDGAKVIHWFEQLPSEIAHWLAALPGELAKIGSNAIQGLISGLKSIPVIGTVLGIGNSIIGTLKSVLHIHSPSQVMYEIGVNIGQGLINGLDSTGKQADAAAKRIADIITNRIKAAQAYAKSVDSSSVQFAGIAGALSGPAFSPPHYTPGHYNAQGVWVAASGTRPPTAGTILHNMGADLARLRRFANAISRLSARGLDSELIQQIVAAGPGEGLEIAEALLHSHSAISRANRLENRIGAASRRIASSATASQYGGGYYQININGGISTAREIAMEVEKILKRLKRHRGGRDLGIA